MPHHVATSVTFPIKNRMYGVNILAKHLNALVESGKIKAWHPGCWMDWTHSEIEIGFESRGDARFAETSQGNWGS